MVKINKSKLKHVAVFKTWKFYWFFSENDRKRLTTLIALIADYYTFNPLFSVTIPFFSRNLINIYDLIFEQLEAEDVLEQLEDVQEVCLEKQLEIYLLPPMVLLLPLPSTTIFHLEDQTLLMRMLKAKTTLILGKGAINIRRQRRP